MRSYRKGSLVRKFVDDHSGNFAMMFALTSFAVFGAVGLSVDYLNLSRIHSEMQSAADAATLAIARSNQLPEAERTKLARDVFDANFSGQTITSFNVTYSGTLGTVTAATNVDNYLIKLIGPKASEVSVSSQATGGIPKTIEIALALDVSGSMLYSLTGSPDRLAALQTAVRNLIGQLKVASSSGFSIKVAVVPFTNAVNIGTNNASYVFNTTHPLFAGTSWAGCVFERPQPATFTDASSPKWGAYIRPPMPNVAGTDDYSGAPSDGTMNAYASMTEDPTNPSPQLIGPNNNCTRFPIVPLTTDLDKVEATVSNYVAWPNMGTHLAAGVSWGMRVLSPQTPFSEGADYGLRAECSKNTRRYHRWRGSD